jgi:hypothetical protein
MTEPIKGKHYRKNGFVFTVFNVDDEFVHFFRCPVKLHGSEAPRTMREEIQIWREQMQDAEELENAQ